MLRKIVIAALSAVVLFYTVIFIQMGTIWFYDLEAFKELFMIFFFLFFTFLVHENIAVFFKSDRFSATSNQVIALLEVLTVVFISILFTVLFIYIPQYLFIPTVEFTAKGIRLTLVVTSFISLFIYYFIERERVRKKLQEEFLRTEQLQKENFRTQLESLKNQINPHFLFNSLNVLNSLIFKDPAKANKFLRQLSEVYRAVLDVSGKSLTSLQSEMDLVNAYIFLMTTRFGDNLKFEISVSPEKMNHELPPSSVQMLIENAIKHNRFTNEEPLKILIYDEDDWLIIKNNIQTRTDKPYSKKIGLQNIINRYKLLTDRQVEIKQTENEFIIRLPLLIVENV